MDVLSIEEMVQWEKQAFATGEATAETLMEAAGREMALRMGHYFPQARDFLVLVGKGNNGGDGLVIARHLASETRNIEVILTVPEADMGELAGKQLARLRAAAASVEVLPWSDDLKFPDSAGVVIDALLGVQARCALRGHLPEIVRRVNAERRSLFFRTVAVDLPSGLAAFAEGEPQNPDDVIIADLTLAVGFIKDLLCREALAGWVGRLEVVPWSRQRFQSRPRQALVGGELAGLLLRRSALSHKNDFGRVVLVAGRLGFTGAAGLCTQAAQAMGAGLLSVVTHPEASAIVAAQAPHEAMVSGWSAANREVLEKASAIAIGPGLGTGPGTRHMLEAVLAVGCPVLIDADALTVLAENFQLLEKAGDVLLTPHPGEMSRLIGRKFQPDEREAVARELTDRHNVTLVLKGTRTLITARGQPFYYNTTGNPGLSTGGSGDTLSGLLAALLGQKLKPIDAARFGVWIHGHAADLVLAERGCEEGLTPTQLSSHLGAALVSLRRMAMVVDGLLESARDGG